MNGYNKNFARGNASGYLYYYFNIRRRICHPPFSTTIQFYSQLAGKVRLGRVPAAGIPYSHGSFNAYVVVGMYGTAYISPGPFPNKVGGGPKQAFFDRTLP